ncbi:hypothetical protein P4T04_06445 [Bacillus badius]|uniref:hypothetical protein n=1 Tax=Bacillus badius TaxID=1455 RepID=UPI002E1EDC50|nr:hypothetical protein [Bacillus badius]
MNTLELLDKVAPKSVKRSRVEAIRDMYLQYRFSIAQKRGIELFLFEPTKEQAFKAMEITPKAWLFIRHVVSDDEIAEAVSHWIKEGKVKSMYIRTIVTNEGLKDLLALLQQFPCKVELERYMKKCRMEARLKR